MAGGRRHRRAGRACGDNRDPLLRLNTAITRLTVTMERLTRDLDRQKDSDREAHRRLWDKTTDRISVSTTMRPGLRAWKEMKKFPPCQNGRKTQLAF